MTFDPCTFKVTDTNRAHLIVCIRSELRKENMTFHKLPGSSNHPVCFF